MPHGVHTHQHELALAIERVRKVVEGVDVRVAEHRGYKGEEDGKGTMVKWANEEREMITGEDEETCVIIKVIECL